MTRLQKKSSAISSIAAAGASREARRRVLHRSERRLMSGRDEQVTTRDAPDALWVNCGRCGTPLLVWLEEVKTCRTIECADCTSRCRHAFAHPSRTQNAKREHGKKP